MQMNETIMYMHVHITVLFKNFGKCTLGRKKRQYSKYSILNDEKALLKGIVKIITLQNYYHYNLFVYCLTYR